MLLINPATKSQRDGLRVSPGSRFTATPAIAASRPTLAFKSLASTPFRLKTPACSAIMRLFTIAAYISTSFSLEISEKPFGSCGASA